MKLRNWLKMVLLGPAMMFGLFAVDMPEGFDPDEWEGLSTEEQEGVVMTGEGELGEVIEDDDELDPEALAAVAGDEEGEGEGTGGEQEGKDAGTGGSGEEAAQVAETIPETPAPVQTGGIPTDEDLLAFRPVVAATELKIPKVETPAEFKEKLAALRDKEAEVDRLFEDGDEQGNFIDKAEHRRRMNEIRDERDEVNREAQEAVFDLKQQARDQARAELEGIKVQEKFFAARPYYGEMENGETTIKADALFGALDKALQKITKAEPSTPFMQRLLKADRAVKEAFGMKDTVKPEAKTEKKPVKPPAPKPGIKTLTDVPVAEQEDTGSDPLAYLDRLSGEKLEKAIEKLTPAQREAYENRY